MYQYGNLSDFEFELLCQGYHGAEDRLSAALFCARQGRRRGYYGDEVIGMSYGAGKTLY